MSNVNKGIKIFAWITGGLILILACLFIPVMKSYLYDPVIPNKRCAMLIRSGMMLSSIVLCIR